MIWKTAEKMNIWIGQVRINILLLEKRKTEHVNFYKVCYLNEVRLNELSNAMKEHSNRISSYDIGAYKTTGTKVEYLLYNYEYYGACKLLWERKKNSN